MGKTRSSSGLSITFIIFLSALCLLPAFNIRAIASTGSGDSFESALRLVRVYRESGRHRLALEVYKGIQEELENAESRTLKALFYSEIGDLHLSVGNGEEALRLLEKGVKEARLSRSRALLGTLLNNMGNAHAVEGDYDRAAGLFSEALELAGTATPASRELPFLTPTIRINLARLRYRSNDQDGAIQQIREASKEIGKLPDSAETAKLLLSVAVMALEIEHPAREHLSFLRRTAWHALTRAEGIGQAGANPRIISSALGYLGRLYEMEARYPEALTLTRRALFHAQEGGFPDILYLRQWQLGRIFRKLERPDASLSAYRSAVSTLTPVRRALVRGQRRRDEFFSSRIRPVYVGLSSLLLSDSARAVDEKEQQSRLIEARDTMEMLKTYELEDFFCDECVTAGRSGMVTLDRAYPGTAILYPLLLEDSLVLLLALPSGMKKVDVPLEEGAELLSLSVRRFRERLQDPSSNRYLYYSKRLYRLLIAPIEEELQRQQVKTLLISPDSVFRMIPFAALHDGENYVVEKWSVGTIPGMTLMKPAPFSLENSPVLLAGLARTTGDKNVLPFVSEELKGIGEITGGRVIRDREFTLENLTDAFKQTDFAVVHMATHGFFGGRPGETYLQTYDGRLTMDRLDRLLSFGRFRKHPVELLTLSACQTALGDERAALGLGGIALKAGVKSAVATLWFISDRAATTVMTEFYGQLSHANTSKAAALQNAQRKLIESKEYRHPAFWAPFLLIGNWM